MEARAILHYARISPRKVQIVLDLIRNQPVNKALAIVRHTPKAASELLEKLLNSAVANGVNDPAKNMDKDRMYVAECFVGPGPTLKRIRPTAKGRAFRVLKRTSHITVVLKEREE